MLMPSVEVYSFCLLLIEAGKLLLARKMFLAENYSNSFEKLKNFERMFLKMSDHKLESLLRR